MKSKKFSEWSNKILVITDYSLAPKLIFIYNRRIGVKFEGNCLIQDDISFTRRNINFQFSMSQKNGQET